MRLVIILVLVFISSFVFSQEYRIDLNQIENDLVIQEKVNGTQFSSYVERGVVEKVGKEFVILKKISFEHNFSSAQVFVNLDRGFIIGDGGVYPEGYQTITDGKLISLVWERDNVSSGDSIVLFIHTSHEENSYGSLAILGILLVFLVLLVLTFRKFFKKENIDNTDKYLLDIERKIIEELKKSDRHELWQKEVQVRLGLSKAKTSRLIRNLESRNLIEKIPFGNTNKVRLK